LQVAMAAVRPQQRRQRQQQQQQRQHHRQRRQPSPLRTPASARSEGRGDRGSAAVLCRALLPRRLRCRRPPAPASYHVVRQCMRRWPGRAAAHVHHRKLCRKAKHLHAQR
jgi:hypothetical protein